MYTLYSVIISLSPEKFDLSVPGITVCCGTGRLVVDVACANVRKGTGCDVID
jgi:hypothetical protein